MNSPEQRSTGGSPSSAGTGIEPRFTFERLNQEYATLSEEERFVAYQAKYGLDEEINETSEFVNLRLQQLDDVLDDIEEVDKEAYETAMFINPEFASAKRFRLAFLRSTSFNVEAAAYKMVRYWENKVEVFGTENAFQTEITLGHFDEEDFDTLASGPIRILPFRDDVGRAIFYEYYPYLKFDRIRSIRKLFWLLIHFALFDNDGHRVQQKGVVCLCCYSNNISYRIPFDIVLRGYTRYMEVLSNDILNCLPIKIPAGHLVAQDSLSLRILEQVLYLLNDESRHRIYFYSLSQVQHNLHKWAECGIQPFTIPKQLGGSLEWSFQEMIYDRLFEDALVGGDSVLQGIPGIQKLRELLAFYERSETTAPLPTPR